MNGGKRIRPKTPSAAVAGTSIERAQSIAAAPPAATQSTIVGPPAAARGAVQKTFASAKLLTGFTDETHRMAVTGEYIRELDPLAQQQQLDAAAVSRAFVATLPPFQLSELVIRPTQGLHIERIQNDPVFRQTLGQRPHQFAYINISQLVALQAWIEPRGDRCNGRSDCL